MLLLLHIVVSKLLTSWCFSRWILCVCILSSSTIFTDLGALNSATKSTMESWVSRVADLESGRNREVVTKIKQENRCIVASNLDQL